MSFCLSNIYVDITYVYIWEIYVYERDLYGIYIIHTHTERDRERETEMKNRNRQRGKNLVLPHVSNSLKSFWPLGGSLESVPYYLLITYLSLRISP